MRVLYCLSACVVCSPSNEIMNVTSRVPKGRAKSLRVARKTATKLPIYMVDLANFHKSSNPESSQKQRIRKRVSFAHLPAQNKHRNASAEGASEKF